MRSGTSRYRPEYRLSAYYRIYPVDRLSTRRQHGAVSTKLQSPLLRLVGARVRTARTKKGLSQEALAHAVNMDRSYVSGVERGEFNVSVLALAKIARAVGVSLAALIGGD